MASNMPATYAFRRERSVELPQPAVCPNALLEDPVASVGDRPSSYGVSVLEHICAMMNFHQSLSLRMLRFSIVFGFVRPAALCV
jgi:hypothetical protein